MVGSPAGSPLGCRLGPGTGEPGVPDAEGLNVGSGAPRRQIGMVRLGVGVAEGSDDGRGVRFGAGGSVGGGTGGTRGSGNCGSWAADITSVRFQSGPYGPEFVCLGAGVTDTGAMLSSRFSVTWPMTLSPARSPMAIAAMSTATPKASTMVMKRFEGSSTGL